MKNITYAIFLVAAIGCQSAPQSLHAQLYAECRNQMFERDQHRVYGASAVVAQCQEYARKRTQ